MPDFLEERLERIALCARSMGIHMDEGGAGVWANKVWPDPNDDRGVYKYDPYTNAEQSQALQEAHKISTRWRAVLDEWSAVSGTSDFYNADLRTAIADCAARLQWELERR